MRWEQEKSLKELGLGFYVRDQSIRELLVSPRNGLWIEMRPAVGSLPATQIRIQFMPFLRNLQEKHREIEMNIKDELREYFNIWFGYELPSN